LTQARVIKRATPPLKAKEIKDLTLSNSSPTAKENRRIKNRAYTIKGDNIHLHSFLTMRDLFTYAIYQNEARYPLSFLIILCSNSNFFGHLQAEQTIEDTHDTKAPFLIHSYKGMILDFYIAGYSEVHQGTDSLGISLQQRVKKLGDVFYGDIQVIHCLLQV